MASIDDLILISVDDHLIEPPDLFADHLDAKYHDRAPKLVRNDEGSDVWMFGEHRDGDRGAQRRGRPPEGGVRPGAAEPRRGAARLLRRPRAGEGHGRRRRARVDELPVVPHLHRPHVLPDRRPRPVQRPRPRLQRLAHRRVVRRLPRPASSRWPCPPSGTRWRRAAEVRRCAAKGCHSLSFTENPAALGYPSFHDELLGPGVAGVRRHRHRAVDPPRARRAGWRSRPSTPRPT